MTGKQVYHVLSMVLLVFVSAAFLRAERDKGHEAEMRQPGREAETEMHQPKGWQFALPKGNPVKGRATFQKFECYACHEVRGENFPASDGESVGPELSQMGPQHPPEYFAESVIHPDAVLEKRYRGPDGNSKMPGFNDDMTVQELIDLSAYLASLKPEKMVRSVTGEGRVIVVVPEEQQVVLEHGAIQGFMGAMTMGYKVEPPKLLQGLHTGDKVRFTLDTEKNAIVKIEKLK